MNGDPQSWFEFPATTDSVARVASCVEKACGDAGFPPLDALRVVLVLEELVTNTVFHGYRGVTSSPRDRRQSGHIWLGLTITASEAVVVYRDAAPPFDPTRHAPIPNIPDRIGGIGLHLVVEATDYLRYSYEDGHNKLVLRFQARNASTQ